MGVRFVKKGDFSETTKLFKEFQKIRPKFEDIGASGVEALRKATPRDTGKTAESWGYAIYPDPNGLKVVWYNSNRVGTGANRRSVAIIIQYGHAFKNGTYVPPRDFINPAMRPIFEKLADETWTMKIEKRKRNKIPKFKRYPKVPDSNLNSD